MTDGPGPSEADALACARVLLAANWPPVARFFDEAGLELETVGGSLRRLFASRHEIDDVGVVVAFVVRGHGFQPYGFDDEHGTKRMEPAMMAALEALVLGVYLGQTRRAWLPEEHEDRR